MARMTEHNNQLTYTLETILAVTAITLGHISEWMVLINPILSTISLTLGIIMLIIRLYQFIINYFKRNIK